MDFDEIITFLAVAEYGNIAKAADQLYIGQGTASSRIIHMEEELGIQVFSRGKGIKRVTLTPEGESLLPIAKQWVSLLQQANQIKNQAVFHELRIATTDMLNRAYFWRIYLDFMEKHPEIQLFLQTEHATEIYQQIAQQQIDLGFVFSLHKYANIVALPLYEEKCVLLYHKGEPFEQTGSFDSLDAKMEVYITMGHDYDLWHQRFFGGRVERNISIGTGSLLENFIQKPKTWAVVPHALAEIMCKMNPELQIAPFKKDPPPARIAYVLVPQNITQVTLGLCRLFLREVFAALEHMPYLQLLAEESTFFDGIGNNHK